MNAEQQRVIEGGSNASRQWRRIERPTGPFPTPAWCGGAHVDFMLGRANSPHMKFKEVAPMPEFKPWAFDGKNEWRRESVDGTLMERYWHGPAVLNATGDAYETERRDGFGGRVFTISPVEGFDKPVKLIGPWHGGQDPGGQDPGWQELVTVNTHDGFYAKNPRAAGPDWTKLGGTFGYYIKQTTLIELLSRFAPHLELAYVKWFNSGYEGVEPYDPAWGVPKAFRENKARGE